MRVSLLASISTVVQESHGAHAAVASGPWWGVLIPILPLVGVLLATLCAIFRVRTKLPAWLSVACLAASFVLTAAMYAQGLHGAASIDVFEWIPLGSHAAADFGLYVDSLTLLWMLFVTGLATLIGLYASEYMSHDVGTGYCRFFAAFNLFVFSMAVLVMADNLILLYLGWEGVGLCSYLLIGYFYTRPSAVAAAKKAFIVNRIGDLGLALGIMLTYVQFGTVSYADLLTHADLQQWLAAARAHDWAAIPFNVQLIPVLLMIGAFGKSAQFPLYVWLPDAMEGPTPVSALIHAATMVTAGVFLIARTQVLFMLSPWALPTVAWIGTITAILAATIGMAQFDIKRIMAYSTCSQLGYMFAGLGVYTSIGAASHVFTHAFFKAALFLCCGAVMHGFAGQLDLRKLSGVQAMPGWRITGIAMLVGCLNLAGFPFTAGFFSKDMILAETFVSGYQVIGWLLVLTAGLTAYYTFRVYLRVFVGPVEYEPGDEHHGEQATDEHDAEHGHHVEHEFHPHAPGWAINSVLTILTVCSLVLGIWLLVDNLGGGHGWAADMAHHSTSFVESPFAHQVHAGEAHHAGTLFGFDPHRAMFFVSAGVGFVGILVAAFLHGPRGAWSLGLGNRTRAGAAPRADALLPRLQPVATWAQRKWYVDEVYDFLVRVPLWVAAHVMHWFDKLVVDGLVNLGGFLPRAVARVIRPTQSGELHGYAIGMVGGLAVLILIVWMASGVGP